MSTKHYNCWDELDSEQMETLKSLSVSTGLDIETIHKVLQAYQEYYMNRIEEILGNDYCGDN
jgi:hypothetical protein